MIEREVRDVLSALAGCVAMRCAAEKNLEDIANMERLQRAVWEIEFSSAADSAAALLPRAEVSRRRVRAKGRTTPAKHSGGSGGDHGDGGSNDSNAKGIGNGTGTPTYSGERCYTTDHISEENHRHHHSHHQQHRVSSLRHGLGERKLVRVHSLGSAKFLFDSALDHRKSGLPVRTRSNGSEISTGGGGEGGQYSSTVSDVWGTQKEKPSSIVNNSNGSSGQSSRSRWGRDNALLKTCFSPFKLAEGVNELPRSVEIATTSTSPTAAFDSADTPRYSPTPTSHRDTLDGGRRRVSPTIGKKPLCGSTWLGPEVSPLPHDQDPRLTRSVNFEASPWSGPKRTLKLRRGRKVIGCRGRGKRDNGIGKEGELELERGMRWQRGRRGDQQRIASISETGNPSPGQQAVGIQACQDGRKVREGGESEFSIISSNTSRKRTHTDGSATAGPDNSEEHEGVTWDCSARANGSSSPSLWQEEEVCPDRVCSSSSCPPLAQGKKTHHGERRGDGLMGKIISETSPKAPFHQSDEGGAESCHYVHVESMREIDYCKQDQLLAKSPENNRGTGKAHARETDGRFGNAFSHNEIPREEEAEFGAEWSPRAHYQSDSPGETNNTADIDDDEETETTTSDEDDDGTGSNDLAFSKSKLTSPQSRDDIVSGDGGGRNEATDDTSSTMFRSSVAKGIPPFPTPDSGNIEDHHFRDDAELEMLRRTEIDGVAFGSAGGVERSAASSSTTTPFRCCSPDVEKSISVARDRMSVERQQQPQNIQYNKHQHQQHQEQQHRLSVKSPKHPHDEPQHHHQHPRPRRRQSQQPHLRWQQPQRRASTGDQVDRSGCNLMQEKLTTLLTKRLKQLTQLEALTIQWERLPRREQEKLDRQQRLMSSRFRLTEQARWDSGVSLSTVPPTVSGPAMTAAAVNHSPTASVTTGVSVSHRSTPSTGGNSRTSASYILPPSDASISASVDLPSPGARDGIDTTARSYLANGASSGEDFRGNCFAVSGRVAARHPRTGNAGGVTPRGQRRRKEDFGRGERGCRGGMACGVRDADIASGRARRWRLGSPSLRIVGVKTSLDGK